MAESASRAALLQVFPGVALAAVVSAGAIYLSELPFPPFTLSGDRHPIEPVMLAIIFGMILANVFTLPKALQPGLKFSTKKLLPLAVVLLGARLDFFHLVRVGAAGLIMSVATIVVALAMFAMFVKWKWVEPKLGLLLGIGTAICGGTAIVAAAPVIEAEEKDVSFGVATVTLCGLIAMFVLPALAGAMKMTDWSFGVWAGLSIHQTPQVIAAGFAYSDPAGETATIVKLARVCLLAPALIFVGWAAHSRGTHRSQRRILLRDLIPLFVIGFLLMALLRTAGWLGVFNTAIGTRALHVDIAKWCEQASKLLIVMSMASVGLETSFAALRRTGARPLLLGCAAAIVICVLTFAAARTLEILLPAASSVTAQ
jgi:uncharacterized integral membrane protein (TIGR00698 family)